MTASRSGVIGASPLRVEDARLLTGRGHFVADVVRPRMLHAAFVRAAPSHARIGRINVEGALALAGVRMVLTAHDLPQATLSSTRHPAVRVTPQPVLAVDRVRFVGEPVAIVLADDRYLAEDGADLVDIDYDSIPPVLQAGAAGPDLFPDIEGNIAFRDQQTFGDIDQAFREATTVVNSSLNFRRQSACPLEARGCVADYDRASRMLTVWSSTQAPHRLRRDLARVVGLPESHIRVVMHDVGGAFGQKIPTHLEDVGVVLAAMTTGQPVKWIEDRQENLVAAPHSRDQSLHLELALDGYANFIGMRAIIVGDAGAYSFNSGSCLTEAYRAARALPGAYHLPAYAYDVTIGLTNKSPIAPYRGVGFVAAQCARELLIDKAARKLSVDRFELRRRNLVSQQELPYTSCTGWVYQDSSFVETLDAARQQLLSAAAPLPATNRLRGIGISPYVEPSGVGSEGGKQLHGFSSPSHDAARVTLDTAGHATATIGTPSLGQGLETTMAQVVADVLGLPMDQVSVAWTDTSQAPISLTGTRASRAAVVSGGALGLAAADVRAQVLEVAAHMLEADPAGLDIRDGHVYVADEMTPQLTVADVAAAEFTQAETRTAGAGRAFESTRMYDPPASYSNACVVAAVTVDPETGEVRVDRIIGVEDCGTMINPMIVRGQFVGAVAQAIGASLLERVAYSDDGQPVTSTLMDYLVPTATDTVPVEVIHLSTPASKTWGGFKGMGESGMIGTVAAIAAAVADAISGAGGAPVGELPLLPETVWRLLRSAPKEAV